MYRLKLTGQGGHGHYIWAAYGLPAGITLSPSGTLSGKPTATGRFSVAVYVMSGHQAAFASLTLRVTK
jgi:hypothetical protein